MKELKARHTITHDDVTNQVNAIMGEEKEGYVRLVCYDGEAEDMPFYRYCSLVEGWQARTKASDANTAAAVRAGLKGEAAFHINRLERDDEFKAALGRWDEGQNNLKSLINETFGDAKEAEELRNEAENLKMKPGESILHFRNRCENLQFDIEARQNPGAGEKGFQRKLHKEAVLSFMLRGIPSSLKDRIQLRTNGSNDLEEVTKAAKALILQDRKQPEGNKKTVNAISDVKEQDEAEPKNMDKEEEGKFEKAGLSPGEINMIRSARKNQANQRGRGRGGRGGRGNHGGGRGGAANQGPRPPSFDEMGRPICWTCQQPGHRRFECPLKTTNNIQWPQQQTQGNGQYQQQYQQNPHQQQAATYQQQPPFQQRPQSLPPAINFLGPQAEERRGFRLDF